MSRYRGHRRGVPPLMLLIALVVAIAAVVLIVINLGKDKKPANDDADTPPITSGNDAQPGNTDDPNTADGNNTSDDVTPTYQKIELKGEEQQYDAVYRVGDAGYEMYTYVDSTAKKYADNVNAVADALAGKATVYAAYPAQLRHQPAGRAVRQGYLRRPEGRRAEDHRLYERQREVRGAV